ncbi:MAG: hypothetical protein JSR73_04255 [Proteobacteria bacterium]|nr:hypothetical protein [Pseudomonadota bacterium]
MAAIALGQSVLRAFKPLVVRWQGTNHSIGASLGLAIGSVALGSELEWLEAADGAAYEAKRSGRGTMRLAGQAPGDPSGRG